MEEKPVKKKRVGNHYIPPPARKQGTVQHDITRTKERPSKLGLKPGKLCDDSSLLFQDSPPIVEQKTKAKRRSKQSSKKDNAENSSISLPAVSQPSLPFGESGKSLIQRSAPHDPCDLPDKIVVKSYLPLNDTENTRSRDAVDDPVSAWRRVDEDTSDSRRHPDEHHVTAWRNVVIPCTHEDHHSDGEIIVNDVQKTELRPIVDERVGCVSEVNRDTVPIPSVPGLVPRNGAFHSQRAETEIKTETNPSATGAVLADSNEPVIAEPNHRESSASSNGTYRGERKSLEESGLNTSSPAVGVRYSHLSNHKSHQREIARDLTRKGELKSQDEACRNTPSSTAGIRYAHLLKTRAPPECLDSKMAGLCDDLDLISVSDSEWDSIYDDSGECLLPQSSPSPKPSGTPVDNLAKVKMSAKEPVPAKNYDNCSSIIEIYGFSEDLKTNDLLSVFGNFIDKGFNLKWVDNTHALGIFPSTFLAEEALTCSLPLVKTRPIAEGTALSQERAKTLVLPSSLRPKTCSALARRLVSGALGLRVKATPEERAAERELLREAREKKKLITKQRDAAWEGNFPSIDGCEDQEPM